MAKYKVFDVIELQNENKATILQINKDNYCCDIVDKNGNSLGVQEITTDEIKRLVFSKNKPFLE